MYNKIYNPRTNRNVNINSTLGKKIIKNYIKTINKKKNNVNKNLYDRKNLKIQMGGIINSVLLIGVTASEIQRIYVDLIPELRNAQIYLLSEDHYLPPPLILPENVHLITGLIMPSSFPDMPVENNYFDTIIVDWSTIKLIRIEPLASFIAMYLRKPVQYDSLSGVFVRDLTWIEFEVNRYSRKTLIQEYEKAISRRFVTLTRLNGEKQEIKLIPGWTTKDYIYYLGLQYPKHLFYNTTMNMELRGQRKESRWLVPELIWDDHFFHNDTISEHLKLGINDFHKVLNEFSKHGLICSIPSEFPFKKANKETEPDSMLQCRWTSIIP